MFCRYPEPPTYIRRLVLAVTVIALAFLFFPACGSNQSDKQGNDMYFNVVDSLLSPALELGTSDWQVRPPKNLTALPDSLMAEFRKTLSSSIEDSSKIMLLEFFLNEQTGASLMISSIAGLNLKSDTAGFMENYRLAIRDEYGMQDIESGDYWHGEVYIKNILVSDSANVQFRLICLKPSNDAVELIYTTPRAVYGDFVKSIESSIGSLH